MHGMALRNEISKSLDPQRRESEITAILSDICEAIRKIQYGSVQIHIQDGKVVQIDKLSKLRIR